jgi:hypothetical protein
MIARRLSESGVRKESIIGMEGQALFKELDTPGKHSSGVEHRFSIILRLRYDMKLQGIDMSPLAHSVFMTV